MAKVFESIDERLTAWIAAQRLFFVASAPSAGGHVNVVVAASWKNARSTDGLPAFDG